jgi:hypothetical protein|tara:strand:+ start:621 stop:851 length:231 start_codon:yes stop_codon:yes gene_type:complete
VLAELEDILNELRAEVDDTRKKNKGFSRMNKNVEYAEHTMYIAGIYKSMSVISDHIRKELKELDKWSEAESKRISD